MKFKYCLCLIVFLHSLLVLSQNEQLAQYYFDKGEFEKAQLSYEALSKDMPQNATYFLKTIACLQQLEKYDEAQKRIESKLDGHPIAVLWIELGYNYQRQKNEEQAQKYYQKAMAMIQKNPDEVYGVASCFEQKSLVNEALQAYQLGVSLNPNFNFNFQMAVLYGQKGQSDLMVEKLLDESAANPGMLPVIQNALSRYLAEDASGHFADVLKKALILRTQKAQDIFWNQFLSWHFVQQKDFGKAFIQEKAIYKRSPDMFSNLINLAQMAANEGEIATANEVYQFVLDNTNDPYLKVQAYYFIEKIKIQKAVATDYAAIDVALEGWIQQYGINQITFDLQKLQAHFVAFYLKNPEKAQMILKRALELPLSYTQMGEAKMELADILLYQEKFNQALIYYSQIENDLKNDVIGQEASLKIAKTSYFQTDFEWANKQLSVLKTASTQLIANDAIDLYLLISDNTVSDSTQTALKKLAHADFLVYQNKNEAALEAFKKILTEHATDEIVPVTLYRMGKIYETMEQWDMALAQYQQIIDRFQDGIYADEAYYFSGNIWSQKQDVAKAKACYEAVIMHHEDSIYYTDAQRKYRQLRGDKAL